MMRFATLVSLTLLVPTGAAPAADAEKELPRLVVVSTQKVKDTVNAKAGDLIQFSVRFPIVPGAILSDLKVEISGDGLRKVAVVRVPIMTPDGKPLMGVGDVSAYLTAENPGEYTVRLTRVTAKGEGDTRMEYKVKVAERKGE